VLLLPPPGWNANLYPISPQHAVRKVTGTHLY